MQVRIQYTILNIVQVYLIQLRNTNNYDIDLKLKNYFFKIMTQIYELLKYCSVFI